MVNHQLSWLASRHKLHMTHNLGTNILVLSRYTQFVNLQQESKIAIIRLHRVLLSQILVRATFVKACMMKFWNKNMTKLKQIFE